MRNTSYLVIVLLLTALALPGFCGSGKGFCDLNGVMWFYPSAYSNTYKEINEKIDSLYDQGIRTVGVYCQYHGNKEKWLGCVALDFFRTQPSCGTVNEWDALVKKVHSKGMKIVVYFGICNIDKNSDFFKKALKQMQLGREGAYEASCFRLAESKTEPLPDTGAPYAPSEWVFYAELEKYVWHYWGDPGFDLYSCNARKEMEKIVKFWLDSGIDGFMFDSGFVHEKLKYNLIEVPKSYKGKDLWLTFESTHSEMAEKYQDFGLTSWFNFEDNDEDNDYSLAIKGIYEQDDLGIVVMKAEEAARKGAMTHAWSIWIDPGECAQAYKDSRCYEQEAAFLAGCGIMYGAPLYESFMEWPEQARKGWSRVMNVINEKSFLHPSASRKVLSSDSDSECLTLSVLCWSKKNSETAILVYNFSSYPCKVWIDLQEVGNLQSLTDIMTGESYCISSDEQVVKINAYGYRFFTCR